MNVPYYLTIEKGLVHFGSEVRKISYRSLHKLTRVKLKLSSMYHPETDGSSKCSNKTINQCIWYHVQHTQKGWVHGLPRICFDTMNSVNASTGFSGFQIQLGHSPRLIPFIVPTTLTPSTTIQEESVCTWELITHLHNNVTEAKNNLMQTKVFQVHFANKHRSAEIPFKIGDKVMLSTLHHQQEFKWKGDNQVTKFSHDMTALMILLTHVSRLLTTPWSYQTPPTPTWRTMLLN